jgi:hypothetical protein
LIKIGFFGDSFCHVKEADPSIGYTTYIKKIEDHYDAEIVSLGVLGSSIYDLMLVQLPTVIEQQGYPDVCVFVWTSPYRLFNRTVRSLNYSTVQHYEPKEHIEIWAAAKQYFQHLIDIELAEFQYRASLSHFDKEVLSRFPKSTKIIHLWSYANDYHYRWQLGVEIRPGLGSVSNAGRDQSLSKSMFDTALNHLEGNERNQVVYEWIVDAVDHYQSGQLKDYYTAGY